MLTFVSLARGVLYVDATGAGANDGSSWANAYTNLQDALASPEDEIWVATGIYRPAPPGDDRNATFQLRSGSALYGGFAGGETNRAQRDPTMNPTILSGDLLGNDGANWTNGSDNSFHVVTATNVDATAVLDGFTITGGNNADFGAGLRLENASPRLANCVIATNLAGIGGGLSAMDSVPLITNCTFRGNLAWSGTVSGGGVYQSGTSVTVVANANPGYAFTNWTEFGEQVSTNDSYTFTCAANRVLLAINIEDLMWSDSDPDGDLITFVGVSATSSNGLALATNATQILVPANAVADGFSYIIADTHGATAIGTATISIITNVTSRGVSLNRAPDGSATISFTSVPWYSYEAERATNGTFTGTLQTWPVQAWADGSIQIQDDFTDLASKPPQAFYRLRDNP